jgi:Fe-S-cluster containining protein
MLFSVIPMIDTFYVHLDFKDKKGRWSINLPFLCTKCGVCCTLNDFLTAGEVEAKSEERPEVHAKIKALFEELGKMWEADETKYEEYTIERPCPFLVDNACSIYEIRPGGCRLFPQTAFGMQTQDCPPLTRFKKQCVALRKGKACKESYYFVGKIADSTEQKEALKPAVFTEKQYKACIAKLCRAGITDEELRFFNEFNMKFKE